LGEGQAKQLSETEEVLDFATSSLTPDVFTIFVHRQESQDLSKN
jgi:hypothetical protein